MPFEKDSAPTGGATQLFCCVILKTLRCFTTEDTEKDTYLFAPDCSDVSDLKRFLLYQSNQSNQVLMFLSLLRALRDPPWLPW